MAIQHTPTSQPNRPVRTRAAPVPGWSARTLAVLIPIALVAIPAGRSDLASCRAIAHLKRRYRHAPRSRTPGLVFVQIDGLSAPVLRQALDAGVMPTLARWLRDGTHRLTSWEAGLPSETSASQAGLLHGANWDIPGFRWYEKERRHLVSSGVPADAEVYNRRISDGHGLLHADGISIGNNVDGDAVHAVVTMSRLRQPDPADTDGVGLVEPEMAEFLMDWAGALHAVLHTGWELLVELNEAWRQRRQNVHPRVDRGGVYPLLSALTTGLLVDLSVYTLTATMLRGLQGLCRLRRSGASRGAVQPRRPARPARPGPADRAIGTGRPRRSAALPVRDPVGPRPVPRRHLPAALRADHRRGSRRVDHGRHPGRADAHRLRSPRAHQRPQAPKPSGAPTPC